MIIFPAIDLKDGNVVRLAQGDMNRATIYHQEPAIQAEEFLQQGAQWLHVVDLDGAVDGKSKNIPVIKDIVKHFTKKVQLGGGIRDQDSIEEWFQLGVERVVLGTVALQDPAFVRRVSRAYPQKIVVAVDAKDGLVATHGWSHVSELAATELAKRFEDTGVASLLFTDIGRDGLLKGVNIPSTIDVAKATSLPVIASGGVAGPQDIRDLTSFESAGIEGVIIGRALYNGTLSLPQALALAT